MAVVPKKTIKNSNTAIAVASPTLNSANIACTIRVPITWLSVVGVWLVNSQITSKAFMPPMTIKTIEIDNTSQISGMVIDQNCLQGDAPSISAAS